MIVMLTAYENDVSSQPSRGETLISNKTTNFF